MKKNILIIASVMLVLAFFSSCYYDKEDFLYAKMTDSVCDTTNVTYSGSVKSIIDNNCIGCHPGSSSASFNGYTALNTYLNTNSQKFLDYVNHASGSSPMPPAPAAKLNTCNLNLIRIWINAGHPNN